ncbi:hypothetical protein LJC61_05130 [Ruminococcaceae bacterium OttesenSCG-928-A16]|nr:hypothetical protein [Ruminococcaceae bacterium OttesenSCG-928-A16]
MKSKYEDIINLPHHVSATRPQMSLANRAAQFSPFAALTGFDAAIAETARLTDVRIELGEGAIAALDMKLGMLEDMIDARPEIAVTYFKPDDRKEGGAYVTVFGTLKKLDDVERVLILTSGEKIAIADILEITGSLFEGHI